MTIFDAHTHVVSHDRARYPISPGIDQEQGWIADAPTDTDDLLRLGAAAGVSRIALVQALSCYGSNNAYLIDSAREHPDSIVSIGLFADAGQLRREVTDHGLRGARVFAFGEADVLGSRATHEVVDAARELGVPVLLMLTGHHIGGVAALARHFSGVDFVLDHCGLTSGPELFALHGLANVTLKVSSLLLGTIDDDPAAFVRALADRFGASRLVWGSDYPHTHHVPYAGLVAEAEAASARLTGAERDEFFWGTATRLWPRG